MEAINSLIPKSESWGLGAAKLLGRVTRASEEVVVSISDAHHPYHSKTVLESAFNLMAAIQPHRVIINGDWWDNFGTSDHNKDHSREDEVAKDIAGGNKSLAIGRQKVPNASWDFIYGNHDLYIEKYIRTKAPALRTLIDPDKMYDFELNEVTPHGRNGVRLRPNFLVKHGDLVRAGSGTTAKGEFHKAKISGVSGHTHRAGRYRADGYKVDQWYEQGCLCRLDPDYTIGVPDWQHGFVIIYLSTKTDAVKVDLIETFNGRFHYGGRSY